MYVQFLYSSVSYLLIRIIHFQSASASVNTYAAMFFISSGENRAGMTLPFCDVNSPYAIIPPLSDKKGKEPENEG